MEDKRRKVKRMDSRTVHPRGSWSQQQLFNELVKEAMKEQSDNTIKEINRKDKSHEEHDKNGERK